VIINHNMALTALGLAAARRGATTPAAALRNVLVATRAWSSAAGPSVTDQMIAYARQEVQSSQTLIAKAPSATACIAAMRHAAGQLASISQCGGARTTRAELSPRILSRR
jgi:hypothetical protein